MIHYHGLPITPATAATKVLAGRHAFVSFAHKDQLEIAVDVCQSFAVDNGAFSAWKNGKPIVNWLPFFDWVESIKYLPNFDFAVIPDVIDGDELANDELIDAWPHEPWLSAPVWHMHESIERLVRLARNWPRVCIGSSGDYTVVGNVIWWSRMTEALNAICKSGQPLCKLHGLRMLNPDVFSRLPLASADSTNIAQNIGIDSAWKGTYQPPNKDWRAMIMAERIESQNGTSFWDGGNKQIVISWL